MVARAPLTRRGLLGLAGLGLVAGASACTADEPSGPPTPRPRRIRYDTTHPDQYGILGMPGSAPRGLVVLVHGGFWSRSYGLDLMDPVAADLRRRGYATWNVEYPRLGDPAVTPTLLGVSVLSAFGAVPDLGLPRGIPTYSVGHSAGGHLAVLAASWDSDDAAPEFVPDSTISLSGVLDLRRGLAQGVGNGAIRPFLDAPGLDPTRQVPARGRVVAVHAEADEVVPVDQSRSYVRAAVAAGGDAALVLVPGGHFDLIDPSSAAWARVVGLLGDTPR